MKETIEEIHNKLFEVKMDPILGAASPHENLDNFLDFTLRQVHIILKKVERGTLSKKDARKTIIIFCGLPGSGKTALSNEARRLAEAKFGIKIQVLGLEDAEMEERLSGGITTPPNFPNSDEELVNTNDRIVFNIFNEMQKEDSILFFLELPILPATLREYEDGSTEFFGRDLGFSPIFDLLRNRDRFIERYLKKQVQVNPNFQLSKADLTIPEFNIFMVGLVGGETLRKIEFLFREAMKNSKSRDEAYEIAITFRKIGLSDPFTEDDWKEMSGRGASPNQNEFIIQQLGSAVNNLPHTFIKRPFNPKSFIEIQKVEASLLRRIFAGSYGLPIKGTFLGINDPPLIDIVGFADFPQFLRLIQRIHLIH